MLFSSSKSWKQIHDLEADLCLNETTHEGQWGLKADGTLGFAQWAIVFLRKLARLRWFTSYKKMAMASCIFIGVQRLGLWEMPQAEDTATEAGRSVRWGTHLLQLHKHEASTRKV